MLSKVGKVHREYNVSCWGGSSQVRWVLNMKTLSGFAKFPGSHKCQRNVYRLILT